MKYLFKITACVLCVTLLVFGLKYVGSEENSINLINKDWGIVKDHPIKLLR